MSKRESTAEDASALGDIGDLDSLVPPSGPCAQYSLTRGEFINTSVRLIEPLTAGGMGCVWIAEHVALHARVAVKFLARALALHPASVTRFAREAAAASRVRSPHVVQMLDYGVTAADVPYIVMELLEGTDLARRLRDRGPLPPEDLAVVIAHAAKALDRAHASGVVHRDVKPENIFLCDVGGGEVFVKLLDFGIAKASGKIPTASSWNGVTPGTPMYMSPEHVLGAEDIDHRADLWSLGVVAFEAMTGVRPMRGETAGELFVSILHAPIPVPSDIDPSIPAAVDEWFRRACARDPAARFSSAGEMARALERALFGAERISPYPRDGDVAPDLAASRSTPITTASRTPVRIQPLRYSPPRQRRPEPALVVPVRPYGLIAAALCGALAVGIAIPASHYVRARAQRLERAVAAIASVPVIVAPARTVTPPPPEIARTPPPPPPADIVRPRAPATPTSTNAATVPARGVARLPGGRATGHMASTEPRLPEPSGLRGIGGGPPPATVAGIPKPAQHAPAPTDTPPEYIEPAPPPNAPIENPYD